ncbi:hypothetical protein SALBM217S_03491 [Streptomyces griseoloalbus]
MPPTTAPAAALLALYDREVRRGARPEGPDDVVERVGRVVRHTAPAHGWNGVVWSGFTSADEADTAIADQIAHYTLPGACPSSGSCTPTTPRRTWAGVSWRPASRPGRTRR